MAKDAIEQIRAAEAEAQRIEDGISAKVKAVLDEAERKRQNMKAAAEEAAVAETGEQLAAMRQRAEQLLARSEEEAKHEAESMRRSAASKASDAVKTILWGIMA